MSVKFIAEIGSNHNNSRDRIEQLIKTAKDIGCYAVKFQLFKGDKLYYKEFPDKIKLAKERELKECLIPKIKQFCDQYEIKLGFTPFYLEAVDLLKDYVDYFKISSFDILRKDLISKCIIAGFPLMISIGLSEPDYDFGYENAKCVFYCCSEYPAPLDHCGLTIIEKLKEKDLYRNIGWSDHSNNAGVIYKAIGLGAEYIEFHLDLEDGKGWETSYGHCWNPKKMAEVIKNVRDGEKALNISENGKVDRIANQCQMADPKDGLRPRKGFRFK